MASTINADNGVSSGSAGLKSAADSSGVLQFLTNGTTAVTVDTSQNVGVGTASPTQRFEVSQLDTTANRTSPINVAAITANSSASAGEPYNGFGPALVFRSRSYNGTIYNGPRVRMAINDNSVQTTQGASLAFDVTNTKGGSPVEAMLLDFSGNLGLGVTPSAWGNNTAIQVHKASFWGISSLPTFSSVGANYYWDTANYRYISSAQSSDYYQFLGQHIWRTAPSGTAGNVISFTQAMTLDSSGNLLVGTTSHTGGTGTIRANTKSGTWGIVVQDAVLNNALVLFLTSTAATVGSITQNGSSTSYNTTSDYRLKDNPQPLTGSGAFIDALKPKTWQWKADGSRGVGFIAHEVQEVSPSSVVGEKDGEQVQAMEYGSAEFIANIIAELQTLRARVAALEGVK